MKNDKLACAVVGVGSMGKNHARVYSELQHVDLAAVVDTDEALGQKIAAQYGAKHFARVEDMLGAMKVDVVSIAVPTSLHFPIASACMESGVNVLLEKPIAPTMEEGERLLALARERKVKVMVGHIERFNPAVTKVKELLSANVLGEVVSVMARRVGAFPPQIKDANIAVDLAIHDIDIVNYMLESTPQAITVHKKRNHIERREDSVEFFLRYPGASAYVQANWITPVKIRKLNITGSEGYLEMDYMNQKIQYYKSNYEKYREELDSKSGFSDYVLKYLDPDLHEIHVAKKEPLKEEIQYFLRAVVAGREIDCTFALDALRVVLYEAEERVGQ